MTPESEQRIPRAPGPDRQPAREYLESLVLHGIKLGLANIKALLESEGSPHLDYPVVHVGGTNGKGSVVAFLDAMLQAAGYRTGRFTSPHLLDVTERFLINGVPMNNEALEEHCAWCRNASEQTGCIPTYFEANTAVAFRWFKREQVDIALVEVGMGGRFDSTNVVLPRACAITNIALDHTQYLGDTLEKIAFEKAGILKAGVPVVLGRIADSPRAVIEDRAKQIGCPVFTPEAGYAFTSGGSPLAPLLHYSGPGADWRNLEPGLAGMHQAENAAIAVTLALLLQNEFTKLTESAVRTGLKSAIWPGRLEWVLENPPVIMDVAHNPAGCEALAAALGECVTVFAASADKDATAMLAILGKIAHPLILTPYAGERSLSLDALRQYARLPNTLVAPALPEALDTGMALASREKPLLVTGSIYASGQARQYLMENHGAAPPVFKKP